jgi:hypothetical protein
MGIWAALPGRPGTEAYVQGCRSCGEFWILERTGEASALRRGETAYERAVRYERQIAAARAAERFSWGRFLRALPGALLALLLGLLGLGASYFVLFAVIKVFVDATMPWAGPECSALLGGGLFFAGLVWLAANGERLDRAYKAFKGEGGR